jgi:transcriptional regulator with XRE-family HTH domain
MNAGDHAYQKAYKRFRARLVQARKDAALTQVEVARRLGRPNSFISKCELGERRVDVVELRQLAKLYGKKMSFFWE